MYQHIATYHWLEPLEALRALGTQTHLTLLYSGQREATTGTDSYLAWGLEKSVHASHFSELPAIAAGAGNLPVWFGYAGYEMRGDIEPADRLKLAHISLPDMCWQHYAHLLHFDHAKQQVSYHMLPGHDPVAMETLAPAPAPDGRYVLEQLFSNFTAAEYQQAIGKTVAAIHNGDFYQANLTRKFWGEMDRAIDPVHMFITLCNTSPAPYSALMRLGDASILSASPECFLSVNASGNMQVRPIKGSARRGQTTEEDEAIKAALLASEKDHAENLMIVDLMRHDLARVATPGSVALDSYAQLHSYATIHHLISSISAQKRNDASPVDVMRALFPPGSMTGAPKIAAMRWCAQHERVERGVYSGALGWLGANGACDLSVVIRTLLLRGKEFEFQAGGGIVADSDPVAEWQEMLIKTSAITTALGIDPQLMQRL